MPRRCAARELVDTIQATEPLFANTRRLTAVYDSGPSGPAAGDAPQLRAVRESANVDNGRARIDAARPERVRGERAADRHRPDERAADAGAPAAEPDPSVAAGGTAIGAAT